MSIVLSSERFGGSYDDPFSSSFTLGWSENQRVNVFFPLSGGLTVTLKSASSREIPYGYLTWIIFNVSPATAFDLTDGTWTESIAGGKSCIVSKVSVAGVATYFIDKRDTL